MTIFALRFYAVLKFICNHSFEGVSNGFECMNKFKKVNLKHLRERASTLQNSGQSLNQFYQFMPLESDKLTGGLTDFEGCRSSSLIILIQRLLLYQLRFFGLGSGRTL